MLILPKSLYSLMILILSHYTVPPKIKLTVSTGGDKQGNNIIEKMCTAKVVCSAHYLMNLFLERLVKGHAHYIS